MERKGRSVRDSALYNQMHTVFPEDLNPSEILYGGKLVDRFIDRIGAIPARIHTGSRIVSVNIDTHFFAPLYPGDLACIDAYVTCAFRSSLEVEVVVRKVEQTGEKQGQMTFVALGWVTFVPLDDGGKPLPVPPITPETDEETQRFEEAARRHEKNKGAAEEIRRRFGISKGKQ